MIGTTTVNNYATNVCDVPNDELNDIAKCNPTGLFFQTQYMGERDGFIVAFNSSNQLVWSTYFGGNKQDIPNSIDFDYQNNRLYITGTTHSDLNFPIINPNTGNYQQSFVGGGVNNKDAFITRFCTTELNGIEQFKKIIRLELEVFPNPSANYISIRLPYTNSNGTLTIYNALGATVSVFVFKGNENSLIEYDISQLTNGLYYVSYVDEKNVLSSKFIKL